MIFRWQSGPMSRKLFGQRLNHSLLLLLGLNPREVGMMFRALGAASNGFVLSSPVRYGTLTQDYLANTITLQAAVETAGSRRSGSKDQCDFCTACSLQLLSISLQFFTFQYFPYAQLNKIMTFLYIADRSCREQCETGWLPKPTPAII